MVSPGATSRVLRVGTEEGKPLRNPGRASAKEGLGASRVGGEDRRGSDGSAISPPPQGRCAHPRHTIPHLHPRGTAAATLKKLWLRAPRWHRALQALERALALCWG